jgi:hypothetical protein
MDSAAVIARLQDQVPTLRRVGIAADLQAVFDGKLADQTGPSAFVVAASERGGRPSAVAGAYIQPTSETIAVVIMLREISNRAGDKAADELETIKAAVKAAITGWKPAGAFAPYALSSGAIIAFKPGYIAWGYEFTAADQLRIAT